MKYFNIFFLLISFSLNIIASSPEYSKVFTPYFDMSLTEATYLPSNANIFTGALVDTRAGALFSFSNKHSFLMLYNFNYTGPGFSPQDTKQFTERTMAHNLNFEYRYRITDKLNLRPAVYFSNEYRRLGSNESWDNGLYNDNAKGGQFSLDYLFDKETSKYLTTSFIYRKIKFPNYTDLFIEFQNPSTQSEIAGNMQDQTLIRYSLTPNLGRFFGEIAYTIQNYDNQKVINENLLYSNSKQKDTDFLINFGLNYSLWVFDILPNISVSFHKSNQNFIRYKSVTDPSPFFVANAYSYKEYNLNLPLDLNITKKWSLSGAFNLIRRNYDSRPPRDINNNYIINEKQNNTMSIITFGIKKKINEITSFRLFYSLTIARSNNKFEAYMPYNYTGNSFGLSYNISY